MEEQAILFEVREDGHILKLVDDRKLKVKPEDTSATAAWYPTMGMTISKGDIGGDFPLKVRSTITGQEINATWFT
jgi:hypothetical protein